MRHFLVGLLAAAVITLAVASVAWAVGELTQKPSPNGCVTSNGTGGACGIGRTGSGSLDYVLVSPDGKHLYARGVASLATFTRDPATGVLSHDPGPGGCMNASGVNGCATEALVGNNGEAFLTPDGEMLYIAANSDNTIGVFDRDPATGALTKLSCVGETAAGGCTDLRGLNNVTHIRLSPDGKQVYAASGIGDSVAILNRDTTTGELSQHADTRGCISLTGAGTCQTSAALNNPRALAVSADGKSVYVTAFEADAIVVFDRDATTGELAQKASPDGCWSASGHGGTCRTATALDSPGNTIEVSPDDENVYATSWGANDAYLIFDRASDGTLTQKADKAGCIADSGAGGLCEDVRSFDLPAAIAFGANSEVYIAAYLSNAITVFDRDANGGLTQKPGKQGCISDTGGADCEDGTALASPDDVTPSPDGKHLYGAHAASLSIFDRATTGATNTTTTTTTATTSTTASTGTTSAPAPAPTTPAPAPVVVPRPPVVAAPAAFKAADFVALPSARKCVSRRRLRVSLKVPRGARVRGADVFVKGKRKARRTAANLTVPVNLTGLPKGTFPVKIDVTLADGRKLSQTRRYKTCAPKRKRG